MELSINSVLSFSLELFRRKKKKADGTNSYIAIESFVDPLTGKRKRATVSFKSGTSRAKAQARRELDDKIEAAINNLKDGQEERLKSYTFGELKHDWFGSWIKTVKPQTIKREKLVIARISMIIDQSTLVNKITPLLIKNCLDDYREKYNSSFSTMQHIKSTLNKIFDYAVLYCGLSFSPAQVVRLKSSVADKVGKKERLENKFLDEREIKVLLTELKKRRNPTYFDLTLFLIGTGCRIGEAGALTSDDIDFEKKSVAIKDSLQSHDLRVDDYYLDTPKTSAGERTEDLPKFAVDALKRCIQWNKLMDQAHKESPSDEFHFSKSIFRTEYGSPITSHNFRAILTRINEWLSDNCEQEYGFKWTKNVVPHSFRHIHISVLRSDPSVTLTEVQERVGHVKEETTAGYTHQLTTSQAKSVQVISNFAEKVGIN
ncbi:MAG TPA: site-specific integrase [Candidatus Levilactobacillus faecigallinarum]|uniref:Site-specific integrase n=1 Tax=Candidatus Levilactobacillus faecigallinarum TaxID=2838638 RepID=A0A9D1U5Y1_9LACO|nr:site-specific integrase [Candidatus Levilactobacillus faecigallinarum]